MTLFYLKKMIGVLVMPINIVLICLLLSIVLINYRKKLSLGFLIVGFCLLLVTSFPYFSGSFIRPIESQYSPFTKQVEPMSYIVVLGCSHTSYIKLPALSQLKACSLQRLVEAIRIFELHPEATIITSGFEGSDIVANAIKVKQAAISLGVPENKIITKPLSKDTEEEAKTISPLLHNKTFALVTNASHMPRAMQYFKHEHTQPIPAPTGFLFKGHGNGLLENLPNATALQRSSVAWYEVLGQFVQWLKL